MNLRPHDEIEGKMGERKIIKPLINQYLSKMGNSKIEQQLPTSQKKIFDCIALYVLLQL